MNCSNPDCNNTLKSELEQYGDVDKPICLHCHMAGLLYCYKCNCWTSHYFFGTDNICLLCEPLTDDERQIMADIQAVEDDLQEQYLQAKLLDFSKG